jgi:hypothetical protein
VPAGKIKFSLVRTKIVLPPGSIRLEGKLMGKIKSLGISAMLVGILLANMVLNVSAGSILKQDEPSEADLQSMYSDSNLPKDIQDKVIDAIRSSALSDNEKKNLIKSLKDIWSKRSKLSESEQQQVFDQTAAIVRDYLGIDRTGVVILWNANSHSDLARTAGVKMGIPSEYSQILYDNANTPDSWPRYWGDHYWFVNSNPPYGDGPYYAKLFANAAKVNININPMAGYTYAADSLHYMSDLSNPFHTSSSIIALFYHGSYETYVSDNWNSGHNFNRTIQNVDSAARIRIDDPEGDAKNLAAQTNQYLNYILYKMISNPTRWKNDARVISNTKNALTYGIRYDMGLVDYITT